MKDYKALIIRCVILFVFVANGISFGMSKDFDKPPHNQMPTGPLLFASLAAALWMGGFVYFALRREYQKDKSTLVPPNWFAPLNSSSQFFHLFAICATSFGLCALVARLLTGRSFFVEIFFLGAGLGMLAGHNWFFKKHCGV
jgi:hypothetical protein